MNKLPGHTDIERMVLGYCILNTQYLDVVRANLAGEDFTQERHRLIWAAMCELYDAGKEVIG